MGVVWGLCLCNVFLTFYAISNISRKKKSISYIYITKIVVLVSEPVRRRSRATELPCSFVKHVFGFSPLAILICDQEKFDSFII